MAENRRRVSEARRFDASNALLHWFESHRRELPWRESRDPYRVWIAEVLLQQTRVATAVRYYDRFLRQFPTVQALARASEGQVLKAWEGAGYYGRARNLRRAAQEIVRRHGGKLPQDVEALEELPGFGPYTAAAVGSLAFGLPVAALEANGMRVLSRYFGIRGDVTLAPNQRRLRSALQGWVHQGPSGPMNEAVMELGETVCAPQSPRCPECPLERGCVLRRERWDPRSVPGRPRKPPVPRVSASIAIIDRNGRWYVQRRPGEGLLGGLWEFPGGKIQPDESPIEACRREVREETGWTPTRLRLLGTVQHDYTHLHVTLHVFGSRCAASAPGPRTGTGRRWVDPATFARLPIPRATQKASQLMSHHL
ncbi:MAG: A/G-specific adenine glycosylase [Thermoplasmata archaeon]|nr:A/G-specific adenine glycosylase [Thermoplasmata archaeon]